MNEQLAQGTDALTIDTARSRAEQEANDFASAFVEIESWRALFVGVASHFDRTVSRHLIVFGSARMSGSGSRKFTRSQSSLYAARHVFGRATF